MRRTVTSVATTVITLAGLTVALVGAASLGLAAAPAGTPAGHETETPVGLAPDAGASGVADALRRHLVRQPGDGRSWADLAVAYVEQARLTLDSALLTRAEEALARAAATVQDEDVVPAAEATLAAARHDFTTALTQADRALRLNPYNAQALAIRTDALTELGRYEEALAAAWQADERRPGVPSFTRLSYAYELRGDLPRARQLLTRALAAAATPADRAFALLHLGDLARATGDLEGARRSYQAALTADPETAAARAGLARVSAAAGALEDSATTWAQVVAGTPLPEYVAEYRDVLTALGRDREAAAQDAVIAGSAALARAAGVRTDLETALFAADHGDPGAAVAAARAEWARRQSVHVADAYAWALHAAGRDAQALPLARASLRLGTPEARFLLHSGVIEAAVGDRALAGSHLRAALRLRSQLTPLQVRAAEHALAELGGAR